MNVTNLALRTSARIITGHGQQERQFLDFIFDSTPTYPAVVAEGFDFITPIWLDGRQWNAESVSRLLGEAEPDAPDERVALYICPECADLGCGAITVAVERGAGTVTWRNWGYQNNYDKGFIVVAGLPDVTFDAAQYGSTLREALDWLLRGQTGHQ